MSGSAGRRKERERLDGPRFRRPIESLQALILDRYPGTTFSLGVGDDPDGVYVIATVDVDDPDEVTDLIIDRLVDLQVNEPLPLYVIPVRTPARVQALVRRGGRSRRGEDAARAALG